jgi:putative transposase
MDVFDLIKEGRIKRFFSATRKLNVPHVVFHITQRAAGKEPLFIEDSDYLMMLALLKETARKYALAVYGFCLMPNHIHVLLSQNEPNLYDAMRYLFSRYAMRFNKKYERKGHLFAGPYRQAACLDDTYLLAASLYIHLNPLRAGLVSDPLHYSWSSYRLYWDDNAPGSFVDPHFILDILSEDGVDKKERYRHMMKEGGALAKAEVFEQPNAIESFRSKITSLFPSLFSTVSERKQIAGSPRMNLLSAEELERQIDAIQKGDFSSKTAGKEARKYIIEQLIARGYKRAEIANRLGISVKTVYNLLRS